MMYLFKRTSVDCSGWSSAQDWLSGAGEAPAAGAALTSVVSRETLTHSCERVEPLNSLAEVLVSHFSPEALAVSSETAALAGVAAGCSSTFPLAKAVSSPAFISVRLALATVGSVAAVVSSAAAGACSWLSASTTSV